MINWKNVCATICILLFLLIFILVWVLSKCWEVYNHILWHMPNCSKNKRLKLRNTTFDITNNKYNSIYQLYYWHDKVWYDENFARYHAKLSCSKNPINSSPNIVFFAENNHLIVVLRSSQTTYEYYQDVRFTQKYIRGYGNIHRGICKVYSELREDILHNILNNYDKYVSVVLFGHSLGGGLVNLLSMELMMKYPKIWEKTFAYASGSPRVFSPSLVNKIEAKDTLGRLVNIVNEPDLVTQIPRPIVECGNETYVYKSCVKNRILFNVMPGERMGDPHKSTLYAKEILKLNTSPIS